MTHDPIQAAISRAANDLYERARRLVPGVPGHLVQRAKPWVGPPVTPPPEPYQRLLDHTGAGSLLHDLIELHGPTPFMVHNDGTVRWWVCEGCDSEGYEAESPGWPCRTIQLIMCSLGEVLE